MTTGQALEGLLWFAQANGLLRSRDVIFARNALLRALQLDAPVSDEAAAGASLSLTATPYLSVLCDDAVETGILEDLPFFRDQYAAHLMNLLMPLPSQVSDRFEAIKATDGIQAATDWFYAFCRACDYIRVDQIARNIEFTADTAYGEMEITINCSKPEKDPREIARLKDLPSTDYPRCMLCVENEGYAGRPGYPSHETLRVLPMRLRGEPWFFQYSPYSYYNEHCIALNAQHTPMAVSRRTFAMLFAFLAEFPHYFIGSNADLPIVGGSILTHDHFQGGRHLFPMDKAPAYASFASDVTPEVCIEAVRWPMTCIRLTCREQDPLVSLADTLLTAWRGYDDPAQGVYHQSGNIPHNTITPIARQTADGYVLHLVLRNNRTTAEHPLGIFHPHEDLHHIKQENIGLIEVMGLFILPDRLCRELPALTPYLTGEKPLVRPAADDPLAKHYDWVVSLLQAHGQAASREAADAVLRGAVAQKCTRVLEDAGVFKPTLEGDAALARFLASVNIHRKDA